MQEVTAAQSYALAEPRAVPAGTVLRRGTLNPALPARAPAHPRVTLTLQLALHVLLLLLLCVSDLLWLQLIHFVRKGQLLLLTCRSTDLLSVRTLQQQCSLHIPASLPAQAHRVYIQPHNCKGSNKTSLTTQRSSGREPASATSANSNASTVLSSFYPGTQQCVTCQDLPAGCPQPAGSAQEQPGT